MVGSSFIDVISLFEQDDQTELIVMCGEIGGDEEERTAEYIAENVSKPVVGYIAGFTAPPGKTMGHAGAIVSGSSGTAAAKAEALEAKACAWAATPPRWPRWPSSAGGEGLSRARVLAPPRSTATSPRPTTRSTGRPATRAATGPASSPAAGREEFYEGVGALTGLDDTSGS